MIYVRTWSHTLNNFRFLVGNFSKEHARLITKINKTHPYDKMFCPLPKFYTRTYVFFTNDIVSSLAAGWYINTWPEKLLHYSSVVKSLQQAWSHVQMSVNDILKIQILYMVSNPRFPLQSHYLVCIENYLFYVGIGSIRAI